MKKMHKTIKIINQAKDLIINLMITINKIKFTHNKKLTILYGKKLKYTYIKELLLK